MDDIRRMSVSERIQLVEDIWDTIAESNQDLPLTSAQETELDRRLQQYSRNPRAGRSWETIREGTEPRS